MWSVYIYVCVKVVKYIFKTFMYLHYFFAGCILWAIVDAFLKEIKDFLVRPSL